MRIVNMIKKIQPQLFITLLLGLFILSGHVIAATAPRIEIGNYSIDMGLIDPQGEDVVRNFTVRNSGEEVLKIIKLSTSCGCTTAVMDKMEIAPGGEATMTVTFDPDLHPIPPGPVTRMIYIQSNDPTLEEVQIELKGTILAEAVAKGSSLEQSSLQPEVEIQAGEPEYKQALVFYNEACTMCAMYINNELIPLLKQYGVEQIKRLDYVNEKANRQLLNEYNKQWNIPPELQAHFAVFVDQKLVLGGHVPGHIVTDLLTHDLPIDRLLVFQDEMSGAVQYEAWGFKGEAQKYPIDGPIAQYIDWFQQNESDLTEPEAYESHWGVSKLLPMVIGTGLLDGINPCAFAVLIFFVAFLFTMKSTVKNILKVGFVFITMIYVAYLLIGLGIVHAFVFSGEEHLMATISAYMLMLLGLVNVKDYFWYGRWFSLSSGVDMNFYKKYLNKFTIPSVMVVGFLVGLCTFPCSGGIYVAIIGLLVSKTTYMSGLGYMLLYNLMFIMPLIVMLLFLTNRRTLGNISRWENTHKRWIKLLSGITMILLGIAILVWFI